MSTPRIAIVPEVAGKSPAMTLKSVVLPAPFGPRMPRLSPGRISRSTLSNCVKTAKTPADPPEQEGRRGAWKRSSGLGHYLVT